MLILQENKQHKQSHGLNQHILLSLRGFHFSSEAVREGCVVPGQG